MSNQTNHSQVTNEIGYYKQLIIDALRTDTYNMNHQQTKPLNELSVTLDLMKRTAKHKETVQNVTLDLENIIRHFEIEQEEKTKRMERERQRQQNNILKNETDIAIVASQICTAHLKAVFANAYNENITTPLPFMQERYLPFITERLKPFEQQIFQKAQRMIEIVTN